MARGSSNRHRGDRNGGFPNDCAKTRHILQQRGPLPPPADYQPLTANSFQVAREHQTTDVPRRGFASWSRRSASSRNRFRPRSNAVSWRLLHQETRLLARQRRRYRVGCFSCRPHGLPGASSWPRISPPGKFPGPLFGGATPLNVWTLTYAPPLRIAAIRSESG